MRDLVFKKIEELQMKPSTINKFFVFSPDELEKDPEGCLDSICDYLEKHKEKIENIEIDSWIDSESFDVVLQIKMIPVESLSLYMKRNSFINNLLPSSVEAFILRSYVQELVNRYSFEFNNPHARKQFVNDLEFFLDLSGKIKDLTTPENVDKGILNFIITHNEKEITINEYLEEVIAKKRFENE